MDSLLFLDFTQLTDQKQRKIEARKDLFDVYDDEKFKERFRLSKPTVQKLLDDVSVYSVVNIFQLQQFSKDTSYRT